MQTEGLPNKTAALAGESLGLCNSWELTKSELHLSKGIKDKYLDDDISMGHEVR